MTDTEQTGLRLSHAGALQDTDSHTLSALLGAGDEGDRVWQPSELAAILKHQLSAPIQVDLTAMEQRLAARLRLAAESQGLLLKSFGDLLHHPNPPLELLKLTKDFAKACRLSRGGPLPREIATVIYFASIVAALVRCRRRISRLDDADTRRGVEQCLAQPWLDDPTRELMEKGLQVLQAGGAPALGRQSPHHHIH